MHLDHRERPGRRILGVPVSIFIFSIILIGIVGVAALVSQQLNVSFVRTTNPSLSLSTSTLAFGTVTDFTTTHAPTFTITNTGTDPLVLSYSTSGSNWPAWATVHLYQTGYSDLGGTNIAGVSLGPREVLTVYPSLQIGQGSGPAADFGGTTFINGE